MMRSLVLTAFLVLASCSSLPERGPRLPKNMTASPSALVAEEMAFGRVAKEQGQATAYREYGARDATVFAPNPQMLGDWLKTANFSGSASVTQVHQVIMACDGKTGVTTGSYKNGAENGYFTSVWQKAEKVDGSGKWFIALRHARALANPRPQPEFVGTRTASCKGRAPASISAPDVGTQMKQGYSRDQSLSWTWTYSAEGKFQLLVRIWNGEALETVLTDTVAAS